MMRFVAPLVLLAIGSLSAVNSLAAPPLPAPTLPDTSAQKAYEYLQVIAGQIGERPAGTEAGDRSVEDISKQFKSWGLDTTVLPIDVPVWHERRARLWAENGVVIDFPAKAI